MPRAALKRVQMPLLLGLLTAVALLSRLVPLLVSGTLGGFRGYDDGVHYAAAASLLHGLLPYRDFVLVHPPGIAVLLLPFALLGQWVGDPAGIAAARIFVVVLGAANTLMVGLLLRHRGFVAVLAGAGLYAVWQAATIAERSIMLSPILSSCTLAALLLLSRRRNLQRRGRGAAVTAGALLGLALCVKVWAVVPVLVVAVLVVVVLGWRSLLQFLTGGLAVCLAVTGPFFAAAPAAMFHDVVSAQLARSDGGGKGLWHRLGDFTHQGLPAWLLACAALLALAALFTAAVVGAHGRRPADWGGPFWWALLAAVITATLFLSQSFFDHYPNFAAPWWSLVIGTAGGAAASAWAGHDAAGNARRAWAPAAASGVVLVALLPIGGAGLVLQPGALTSVSNPALAQAAAGSNCVFAPYSYMAVMADSLSRSLDHGCGQVVDAFGTGMVDAADLARTQVAELDHADAAVVALPLASYGFTAPAAAKLLAEFEPMVASGNFEVWIRRP